MVIQAGSLQLNDEDVAYTVTFANPFYDDGQDIRVFTSVANTSADVTKEEITVLVTDKSPTGFTVALSSVPNTVNYVLDWSAESLRFAADVNIPVEPHWNNTDPPKNSFGIGPL